MINPEVDQDMANVVNKAIVLAKTALKEYPDPAVAMIVVKDTLEKYGTGDKNLTIAVLAIRLASLEDLPS